MCVYTQVCLIYRSNHSPFLGISPSHLFGWSPSQGPRCPVIIRMPTFVTFSGTRSMGRSASSPVPWGTKSRKTPAKSWENHEKSWKIMGKSWQKSWESHGKNHGKVMGKSWKIIENHENDGNKQMFFLPPVGVAWGGTLNSHGHLQAYLLKRYVSCYPFAPAHLLDGLL